MNDVMKQILYEDGIAQKAYEIDLNKLDEGYLSDIILCYVENRNKAKKKLLNEVRYSDWKLKYSGDELNYLNIPIRRAKKYDKVIFEGKETTRCKIEDIIQERERLAKLDAILNDSNVEYCYISKGGYYCPNWAGYTSHKTQAGVYTKEEAVQHAKSVREISLIPINNDEHNMRINKAIDDLKTRLI